MSLLLCLQLALKLGLSNITYASGGGAKALQTVAIPAEILREQEQLGPNSTVQGSGAYNIRLDLFYFNQATNNLYLLGEGGIQTIYGAFT